MEHIFKRGKKKNSYYYADMWHDGTRIRNCLNTSNLAEAVLRLSDHIRAVEGGDYQKGNVKFEKVTAEYKPTTNVTRKLSLVRIHLLPILKGKKLWDLDVDAFLEIKRHELSQSSLSQLMGVMRELGWKFKGVSSTKPSKRAGIAQVISWDQFHDFFDRCCPRRYRAFSKVAFYSTLRLTDVKRLSKKHVNFDKDAKGKYIDGVAGIRIVPSKTSKKNPTAVFCPMTKNLHDAFLDLGIHPLNSDDLWFKEENFKAVNISQAAKRGFDKAGMPWASFQQLRRFGATYLYKHGMHISVVKNLLHHTTTQQTEDYLASGEDELIKGMALFDEIPKQPAQNQHKVGAR